MSACYFRVTAPNMEHLMWILIAPQKGKRHFFLIKLIVKYDEINRCLYVNSATAQWFKRSQVIVKNVKNIEDIKNVACGKSYNNRHCRVSFTKFGNTIIRAEIICNIIEMDAILKRAKKEVLYFSMPSSSCVSVEGNAETDSTAKLVPLHVQ